MKIQLTFALLRDLDRIFNGDEFEFLSLSTAFLTSFVRSFSSRSALSMSITFFCDFVMGTSRRRESGCSTSYSRLTTPSSCSSLSISDWPFFGLVGAAALGDLSVAGLLVAVTFAAAA